MMEIILKAFWFFLPAYFANATPLIFKKINFLSKPVNKKFFGSHKTYRGFFLGIIFAELIIILQTFLRDVSFFSSIIIFPYDFPTSLFLGFLLGFGALFGDLIKSYFKRRIGVAEGKRWLIVDQLDYVFGGLLFSLLIFNPGLLVIITLILLSFILTIIIDIIGVSLGFRKEW